MCRRRQVQRGFTLLEVLAASAIAAALAAALAASLHVAFNARKVTMRTLEHGREARLALDAIERDLTTALPPTGVLAGAFIGEDLGGAGGEADKLSFFRAAQPGKEGIESGDIRGVEVALADPAELLQPSDELTRTVLVRRVQSNLLRQVTTDPQERVICRGVTSLNLRYFDPYAADWVDSWDSTAVDNALPSAVEVTLVVAEEDSPVIAARRVFVVGCGSSAEE